MVELGLLALMAALSVGTFFLPHEVSDSGDDDDDTGVDQQENQEDLTEAAETGATMNVTADGVNIDVGADETRSLAVIYFVDTQDDEDPDNFVLTDEARFYLVPEDVDWSAADWDQQYLMPDAENEEDIIDAYDLDTFEERYGLELIGTVDLKGVSNDVEAPADRIGELTSNVQISGYYLEAATDGDYLVSFLPEDYVETRNGLVQQTVTTDTVGTDDLEWFFTEEDGISLDGAGGADILETTGETVTITGGAGDDSIYAEGVDNIIQSGGGDDLIYSGGGELDLGKGDDSAAITTGDATVHGGAGDDSISGSNGLSTFFGESGDDNLSVSGAGSVARGGNGADFLGVRTGATGYGGAGDDHLQVDRGSRAFGGAGNDLFQIWDFLNEDSGPAVITLGEGNDTVEVAARNASGGVADDIYLRITDFDPDEDVLQVGAYNSGRVDSVEIVEADDGSHTDVRVTYRERGLTPGIAVIRLDGTPGITEDQILLAK